MLLVLFLSVVSFVFLFLLFVYQKRSTQLVYYSRAEYLYTSVVAVVLYMRYTSYTLNSFLFVTIITQKGILSNLMQILHSWYIPLGVLDAPIKRKHDEIGTQVWLTLTRSNRSLLSISRWLGLDLSIALYFWPISFKLREGSY